ncbi:oligosaccharide repeat unit polymerase [Rhizobium helianthi]|uniref:Oligosaccharide repeat unit polymerase n=1 Tax=Rhizobium helianthi TaxID=1132695 RepID=A0ABW4M9H0_9HYPH
MPLFFSLLIGCFGLFAYWRTQCWSHPAVIFALFWCFMTCMPQLFVPQIDVPLMPTLYIMSAAIIYGAPAFTQDWSGPIAEARRRSASHNVKQYNLLIIVFGFCQIATLSVTLGNLNAQGFPLARALIDPIGTGCEYLALRYSGNFTPNVFSQTATILNYFCAILAGFLLPRIRNILVQLAVLTFALLPSLVFMIMYADKGTLFLAAAFMFGATLVERHSFGKTYLLTPRTVAAGVVLVILLIPAVAISLLNRTTVGACSETGRSAEVVEGLASALITRSQAPDIGLNGDSPVSDQPAEPEIAIQSPVVPNEEAALKDSSETNKPAESQIAIQSPVAPNEEAALKDSSETNKPAESEIAIQSPVVPNEEAAHKDSSETNKPAESKVEILSPSVPNEEGSQASSSPSGLGNYVRSYAFGHFFAFTHWLEAYYNEKPSSYIDPNHRTWGFWTFMAIGRIMNPGYELPPGYFTEYYRVDGLIMSNIYTLYRGLIYDFGIVGSLIFMGLFGWVSSAAYRQLLEYKNAPASQAFFILLIGFIYTSYIISLLVWKSAWLVTAIVWAALAGKSFATRRFPKRNQPEKRV